MFALHNRLQLSIFIQHVALHNMAFSKKIRGAITDLADRWDFADFTAPWAGFETVFPRNRTAYGLAEMLITRSFLRLLVVQSKEALFRVWLGVRSYYMAPSL